MAQKFIDITAEGVPDENEPPPTMSGVKRSADEAGLGHARETSNAEEMDELINQAVHMDQDGEDMLSQPTEVPDSVMGVESSSTTRQRTESNPVSGEPGESAGARNDNASSTVVTKSLEEALRESVDILDVGRSRTPRTPLVRHGLGENMEVDPTHIPLPESDDDSFEVFYTVNDDGAWETFYAAKNRTEASMKDLNEDEVDQRAWRKSGQSSLRRNPSRCTTARTQRSSEQPFQKSRFWIRAL